MRFSAGDPRLPASITQSRTALDGKLIYDVDYTIDGNRLRQTVSGAAGPTIAFFGNSFTFGEGVNDADALPQAFADIDGRRLRVLNLGFSGYGPQQFLRAVETGLFDPLLSSAKLFVLQTSAWHAERTSCLASFTLRAPRYAMQDGAPVYQGPCASGLMRHLKEFLYNSDTVRKFFVPAIAHLGGSDIDLYVAEVVRAAQISKERYHVPTLVLYLPAGAAYLGKSGRTDTEIEAAFRKAGILVLDGSVSAAQFPPGLPSTWSATGTPRPSCSMPGRECYTTSCAPSSQRYLPPRRQPLTTERDRSRAGGGGADRSGNEGHQAAARQTARRANEEAMLVENAPPRVGMPLRPGLTI